jgi:uncharacterized lipoprotein YmbA
MTAVRLLLCALTLAGCATPTRTTTTPSTSTYRLCSDPQFEGLCTPASMVTPAAEPAPIQVDTNLKAPNVFTTRLG